MKGGLSSIVFCSSIECHTYTPHSLSLRGTHSIACERRKEIFSRFVKFFCIFRGYTVSTLWKRSLGDSVQSYTNNVVDLLPVFGLIFWKRRFFVLEYTCVRRNLKCDVFCCYIAMAASQNGVIII